MAEKRVPFVEKVDTISIVDIPTASSIRSAAREVIKSRTKKKRIDNLNNDTPDQIVSN